MKIEFHCLDSYEAEKLSSIFSLQKDNSLFVKDVMKVIDNEVIVNLKDGSHHSILFKDNNNALRLKKMFDDIRINSNEITSTYFWNDQAFITLKK